MVRNVDGSKSEYICAIWSPRISFDLVHAETNHHTRTHTLTHRHTHIKALPDFHDPLLLFSPPLVSLRSPLAVT